MQPGPGKRTMSEHDWLVRYLYIPLAALMGALSSLGARRWQGMSKGRVTFEVVVHASFAMFVTPWAAQKFVGVSMDDARAIVGLTYLFAFAAPVLLPRFKHWLERLVGTGDTQ